MRRKNRRVLMLLKNSFIQIAVLDRLTGSCGAAARFCLQAPLRVLIQNFNGS